MSDRMETNGRMIASLEQVESDLAGAITAALITVGHKITEDQVVIYRTGKSDANALAQLVDALIAKLVPLLRNATEADPAQALATVAHELFVGGDVLNAAAVDTAVANAAKVATIRCAELAQDRGLARYATRFSVQVHPRVAIYLEALSKEFGASLGSLSSELLNRAVYRMHPEIVRRTPANGSPEPGVQQHPETQTASMSHPEDSEVSQIGNGKLSLGTAREIIATIMNCQTNAVRIDQLEQATPHAAQVVLADGQRWRIVADSEGFEKGAGVTVYDPDGKAVQLPWEDVHAHDLNEAAQL